MVPRTALVTGAAKRLGAETCRALAGAGYRVAVHFHTSRAEAEALADEIGGVAVQADLADEAAVQALLPAAAAQIGPIGVLINNASTFERDEWDTATRESWDYHLEPNLRAPFVLMQALARQLPAEAEGAVVNMIDQRVWSLTPHFVSYTVSKAGLWALTQQMALALAPRIRVNAIGPGPALPSARQTEAQFAAACAALPLARGTSPHEVAAAVLAILAMPSMTGQMIALDGGQHLQWGRAFAE